MLNLLKRLFRYLIAVELYFKIKCSWQHALDFADLNVREMFEKFN